VSAQGLGASTIRPDRQSTLNADEGPPVADVLGAEPPDDSGSLTFARYCYQARIAFRYALACAQGQAVLTLVPEHFEDLAVSFDSGDWAFLQIKTRDPGRGPWRLGDVLGADGAFRSLLRTYRALEASGVTMELVACLEGAIASGDDLQCFVGTTCSDDAVISRVEDRLELSPDERARFTPLLRVRPESPMSSIDDVNVRRLAACMPSQRVGEVELAYARALGLIQTGMEAALLGPSWPLVTVSPGSSPPTRVEGKVIDRDRLRWLSDQMETYPAPLISRLIGSDRWPASQLEEKLLEGGASTDVIGNASEMRAGADRWISERQAASLWPDDDVSDDVDLRLRYLATASVARYSHEAAPANLAWADIHQRLSAEASVHDPNHVYAQDPVLLMGRVCSLSDQCEFPWRAIGA
jgi:hypothetical protein